MPRTAISGLVCTTFLVLLGFPAVPQELAGKGADTESGNKHSTTHAGPAIRPRKATIAWVRTSTISSEGKPVRSRTTAIPAP
jgi:hypothetical protein